MNTIQRTRHEATNARIYDPVEKAAWENSGLVNVISLRKGDVFETRDGLLHVWVREDDGTVHGRGYDHDEYNAHMVGTCKVRKVEPYVLPIVRSNYRRG